MSTEDRPSPSGTPYSSSASGAESGEMYEAAERLERASWDRMLNEAEHYDPGTHGEASQHSSPILSFLETQLRERPLPTLLAAVAAGWLVGKLLR